MGDMARRCIWATVLAAVLVGCSSKGGGPDEVLVFAAASLADVLDEISEEFEKEDRTVVSISYGGSQMLAQQIASGAPADLLISAGEFPVGFLQLRGLVESAPSDIVANGLVVAVRSRGGPRITAMDDLRTATVRRIAIADPELAPAGRYARESLRSLGLWDVLEPKLVVGPDVRATLAYVESGNSEAALVYRTDARASGKVRILDIVPGDSYSRIRYPAAIVAASRHKTAATRFLRFLEGKKSLEIFRRFGFEPVPAD